MPFRRIAEQLGISTKTVIQRYKRLRENLLTLSTVTLDLNKLGYGAIGNLYIKVTNRSKLTEIYNQLLKIPNVIVIIRLLGTYDLYVAVALENFDKMFETRSRLNRISGIEKREVYITPMPPMWPFNLFQSLLENRGFAKVLGSRRKRQARIRRRRRIELSILVFWLCFVFQRVLAKRLSSNNPFLNINQGTQMKPHITLVNPAAPAKATMHMPFALLGLGYLAAVLEKNGYQVDVIDCQILNLSMEEFRSEIGKRKPDIVGVTSSTLTYKTSLKLIKIAREACPNAVTIAGGPHVTFWDDHALEECPELDVVVRREGEYTMLELAQRIEAGKPYSDVVGTTCRVERENHTQPRPPLHRRPRCIAVPRTPPLAHGAVPRTRRRPLFGG